MKVLIHKLLILIIANVYIATVVEAADCPTGGAAYDMQKGKLYLPGVLVGHNGSIFEAKLDLLDSHNAFQFHLTDLTLLENSSALAHGMYHPDNQLLNIPSLCLHSEDSEQLVTQIEMQLIPYSEPLQLLLKRASDSSGNSIFN